MYLGGWAGAGAQQPRAPQGKGMGWAGSPGETNFLVLYRGMFPGARKPRHAVHLARVITRAWLSPSFGARLSACLPACLPNLQARLTCLSRRRTRTTSARCAVARHARRPSTSRSPTMTPCCPCCTRCRTWVMPLPALPGASPNACAAPGRHSCSVGWLVGWSPRAAHTLPLHWPLYMARQTVVPAQNAWPGPHKCAPWPT